ncbi:uncharacterized protein LOC131929728 [Physella acuta]|uniref:uncharacterized protein LOC131929728 n=1 Tax=Physella acuta TaxID=109671 RepID=UPI0027DC260D|nr:uncharacterized protein LOC131929728 [Physella acuta]
MSKKKNSAGVSPVRLTHLTPQTGDSEYFNTTRSDHTYCTIDTPTNGTHDKHDDPESYPFPVRQSTTIRNLNNHQSPVYQNLLTPYARSSSNSNSTKQCCFRKRCLIIIIIVSLITSLTTVGWMSFKYTETMMYELSRGVGSHETCVECQRLREDSDVVLLERLSQRVVNSTTMCCAVTAGQMSALIQLMSIREDRIRSWNEANRKRFIFIPVSAHVNVASLTEEVKGESNVAIRTPSNRDKGSTYSRGVTIYNNSVLIRHSGTYLVYVSLLLESENNTNCSREKTRVAITRVRGKTRTCLMEMFYIDELCLGTYQTLYSSGVFRLLEKDQIFANLSGKAKVKDGQKLSFLGLAMLRSN